MRSVAEHIRYFVFPEEQDLLSRRGRWISILFFVVALHLLYRHVGVYQFIHARPVSVHISAQTSRACVALNYYKNDMNFFTPQYQRTLTGEGYTGLEFPIIYYTGAVMYKLFGFNEMYLRVLSLLLTSFGLIFFYLLAVWYTRNRLLSLGIIGALLVSPVFLFYTPNFMPDTPSLALIMAAWYFFFRYSRQNRMADLNWFTFLSALGVLLKISGAMCYGVVVGVLVLDQFRFFRTESKGILLPHKGKILLRMALAMILVVSWYKYTAWYPTTKGDTTFLLSPNHYENWEGMLEVLDWMKNLWFFHYFSLESWLLLAFLFLLFIVFSFKASRFLLSVTLFYFLGCVFYFLVFLNQFKHHDYYVIAMFPLFFFLFLSMAEGVKEWKSRTGLWMSMLFSLLIMSGVVLGSYQTKIKYHERYSTDIYYWTGDFRAYEDLEPRLRALGIQRTDRFVVGFDKTDCASLYLMDQLGSTFEENHDQHWVDSLIFHPNVKYLVLTDSAEFRKRFTHDFSNKVVLRHRGLIIYKLK